MVRLAVLITRRLTAFFLPRGVWFCWRPSGTGVLGGGASVSLPLSLSVASVASAELVDSARATSPPALPALPATVAVVSPGR